MQKVWGLRLNCWPLPKKVKNELEVRVHPTLISKDHPLAAINGIYNAVFISTDPLGDILLSGEGAGQMAAASGVVSDLINLAANGNDAKSNRLSNFYKETSAIKIKKMDDVYTRFYIRFKALDKPGVLSKITGILGKQGIGINSVSQKVHSEASDVPVIMLSDYVSEKKLRTALDKICKLPIVKSKPVAIRMEKLK